MNSHCLLLKPTKEIDLNTNVKILTLQLTNMEFGFYKAINRERLNNIEVYILVD